MSEATKEEVSIFVYSFEILDGVNWYWRIEGKGLRVEASGQRYRATESEAREEALMVCADLGWEVVKEDVDERRG